MHHKCLRPCVYVYVHYCLRVYVFILKMCELCLDGYEASDSKAKPGAISLKSGVQFPRVYVQSGGLGAERQLRSSSLR